MRREHYLCCWLCWVLEDEFFKQRQPLPHILQWFHFRWWQRGSVASRKTFLSAICVMCPWDCTARRLEVTLPSWAPRWWRSCCLLAWGLPLSVLLLLFKRGISVWSLSAAGLCWKCSEADGWCFQGMAFPLRSTVLVVFCVIYCLVVGLQRPSVFRRYLVMALNPPAEEAVGACLLAWRVSFHSMKWGPLAVPWAVRADLGASHCHVVHDRPIAPFCLWTTKSLRLTSASFSSFFV